MKGIRGLRHRHMVAALVVGQLLLPILPQFHLAFSAHGHLRHEIHGEIVDVCTALTRRDQEPDQPTTDALGATAPGHGHDRFVVCGLSELHVPSYHETGSSPTFIRHEPGSRVPASGHQRCQHTTDVLVLAPKQSPPAHT